MPDSIRRTGSSHPVLLEKRRNSKCKDSRTHRNHPIPRTYHLCSRTTTQSQDSHISRHANSNKHGDIEMQWKIGRKERTVADVTMTHPRHGSTSDDFSIQIGTWKKDALKTAEKFKIDKHNEGYNSINDNPIAFIPVAMTTY